MPEDILLKLGVDTAAARAAVATLAQQSQTLLAQASSKGLKSGVGNFSIDPRSFSRPLGTIRGQLGEFNKSLEASNARVIAFGASAGSFFLLQRAITATVQATIDVERKLVSLNSILGTSSTGLADFGNSLFSIAKNTGSAFSEVASAAEELARQGLGAQETLTRTKDAMILARVSGLGVVSSVEAITAALNSFNETGITSTELINKLVAVDANFAVSSADLAESIKRVGSSAIDAGVGIDELLAVVTSAQQITARGGAVIGNSFKTIFTRIQRPAVLDSLENIGVETRKSNGELLGSIDILKNLAVAYDALGASQRSQVAELVGGVYQINILKSIVKDLSSEYGSYSSALKTSANATDEAITKNDALNKSLSSILQETGTNLTKFASDAGKVSLEPILKGALGAFNQFSDAVSGSGSGDFILKGLGEFFKGPGLTLGLVAAANLAGKFSSFLVDAIRTVTGLASAQNQLNGLTTHYTELLRQNPVLQAELLSGVKTVSQVQAQLLSQLDVEILKRAEIAALAKQLATATAGKGAAIIPSGQPNAGLLTRVKTSAGGFIPKETQAAERMGALAGGYTPGQILSTNIPGMGQVVYNSAETKKSFEGMSQDAIMPPPNSSAGRNYAKEFKGVHGFNPYAASGLIPNFAINWNLPPSPGSTPVSGDEERLYHQTDSKNLSNIRRNGILLEKARGIEGPKAIYADKKGFYGRPEDVPTVEFRVPKERFKYAPFVTGDVKKNEIIATHRPWHQEARMTEQEPKTVQAILRGEFDYLLEAKDSTSKAVRFIKHKYARKKTASGGFVPNFFPQISRSQAAKLLKENRQKISSLTYNSASLGREVEVDGLQWSSAVRHDLKTGTRPGNVKRQEQGEFVTLRGRFDKGKKVEIKNINLDKIKQIRSAGEDYNIVNKGLVPNFVKIPSGIPHGEGEFGKLLGNLGGAISFGRVASLKANEFVKEAPVLKNFYDKEWIARKLTDEIVGVETFKRKSILADPQQKKLLNNAGISDSLFEVLTNGLRNKINTPELKQRIIKGEFSSGFLPYANKGLVPNFAQFSRRDAEPVPDALASRGFEYLSKGAESRAFLRKGTLVAKQPRPGLIMGGSAEYPKKVIASANANRVFEAMGLPLEAARVRQGTVGGTPTLFQKYSGRTLGTLADEMPQHRGIDEKILKFIREKRENFQMGYSESKRLGGGVVVGLDLGSSHNFTVKNEKEFKEAVIGGRSIPDIMRAGRLTAIDLGGYNKGFVPNFAPFSRKAASRADLMKIMRNPEKFISNYTDKDGGLFLGQLSGDAMNNILPGIVKRRNELKSLGVKTIKGYTFPDEAKLIKNPTLKEGYSENESGVGFLNLKLSKGFVPNFAGEGFGSKFGGLLKQGAFGAAEFFLPGIGEAASASGLDKLEKPHIKAMASAAVAAAKKPIVGKHRKEFNRAQQLQGPQQSSLLKWASMPALAAGGFVPNFATQIKKYKDIEGDNIVVRQRQKGNLFSRKVTDESKYQTPYSRFERGIKFDVDKTPYEASISSGGVLSFNQADSEKYNLTNVGAFKVMNELKKNLPTLLKNSKHKKIEFSPLEEVRGKLFARTLKNLGIKVGKGRFESDVTFDNPYAASGLVPNFAITSAAYKTKANKIYTGRAHYEAYAKIPHGEQFGNLTAGFIDDKLGFLTREQAFPIAEKNGQLNKVNPIKGLPDSIKERIKFANPTQPLLLDTAYIKLPYANKGLVPNFAGSSSVKRAMDTEKKMGGRPVLDFEPGFGPYVRDGKTQANFVDVKRDHPNLRSAISDSRRMQTSSRGFVPNFAAAAPPTNPVADTSFQKAFGLGIAGSALASVDNPGTAFTGDLLNASASFMLLKSVNKKYGLAMGGVVAGAQVLSSGFTRFGGPQKDMIKAFEDSAKRNQEVNDSLSSYQQTLSALEQAQKSGATKTQTIVKLQDELARTLFTIPDELRKKLLTAVSPEQTLDTIGQIRQSETRTGKQDKLASDLISRGSFSSPLTLMERMGSGKEKATKSVAKNIFGALDTQKIAESSPTFSGANLSGQLKKFGLSGMLAEQIDAYDKDLQEALAAQFNSYAQEVVNRLKREKIVASVREPLREQVTGLQQKEKAAEKRFVMARGNLIQESVSSREFSSQKNQDQSRLALASMRGGVTTAKGLLSEKESQKIGAGVESLSIRQKFSEDISKTMEAAIDKTRDKFNEALGDTGQSNSSPKNNKASQEFASLIAKPNLTVDELKSGTTGILKGLRKDSAALDVSADLNETKKDLAKIAGVLEQSLKLQEIQNRIDSEILRQAQAKTIGGGVQDFLKQGSLQDRTSDIRGSISRFQSKSQKGQGSLELIKQLQEYGGVSADNKGVEKLRNVAIDEYQKNLVNRANVFAAQLNKAGLKDEASAVKNQDFYAIAKRAVMGETGGTQAQLPPEVKALLAEGAALKNKQATETASPLFKEISTSFQNAVNGSAFVTAAEEFKVAGIQLAQAAEALKALLAKTSSDVSKAYTQAEQSFPVSKPKAGGHIPNFATRGAIERTLASQGGYEAGAIRSMGDITYNSAEKIVNKPGFDGPFINPPAFSKAGLAHRKKSMSTIGVDPYMALGGIPNFVKRRPEASSPLPVPLASDTYNQNTDENESIGNLLMGTGGKQSKKRFISKSAEKKLIDYFLKPEIKPPNKTNAPRVSMFQGPKTVPGMKMGVGFGGINLKSGEIRDAVTAYNTVKIQALNSGVPAHKIPSLMEVIGGDSRNSVKPLSMTRKFPKYLPYDPKSVGGTYSPTHGEIYVRPRISVGRAGQITTHEMVHRFQDVSRAFKSSKTLSQLGSMFGPENVIRAQGSTSMVQAALMKQGVTGFQLTSHLAESRSVEEMAHGLENRVSEQGYRTLFDKTSAKFRDDVLGKGAGARIDTEVEALRRLKLEQEIQTSNRLRSTPSLNKNLPGLNSAGAAKKIYNLTNRQAGIQESELERHWNRVARQRAKVDTQTSGSPGIVSSGEIPRNFKPSQQQRPGSYKPESFAKGSLKYAGKLLQAYGSYETVKHLGGMAKEAYTTGSASAQLGDQRGALLESALGLGAGVAGLAGGGGAAAATATTFGLTRVATALGGATLGIAAAPLIVTGAVLSAGYQYYQSQQEIKLLEQQSKEYLEKVNKYHGVVKSASVIRDQTEADSLARTIEFLKADQKDPSTGIGKNNEEKIQKLEEYRQTLLAMNQGRINGFATSKVEQGQSLAERRDRGQAYLKSLGMSNKTYINSEELYDRLNPEINIENRKAAMKKAYTELEATQRAEKLDKLPLGDRIKALQADIAWNKNPIRAEALKGDLKDAVLDYNSYAGAINYVDSYKNKVVQYRIGLINRSYAEINSPNAPKWRKDQLSKLIADETLKLPNSKGEGGQFDFFTLVNGERVALTEEDYIKKMAASNRERASKNKAFGSIPEFNQAFGREENALRARGVSNPKDLIYAGTSPRITSNSGNLGVFNRLDEPNGPVDAFAGRGRIPNFAASSNSGNVESSIAMQKGANDILTGATSISKSADSTIVSVNALVAAFAKPQKVNVQSAGEINVNMKISGDVSVKDSPTIKAELDKIKAEILLAVKEFDKVFGAGLESKINTSRGAAPAAAPAPAPRP